MRILIPVILSAILYMIIGMLWYGPIFGKKWFNLRGVKEKDVDKSNMKTIMLLSLVSATVTISVLFLLFVRIPGMQFLDFLIMTILVWVGFTFVPVFVNSLYTSKKTELVLIDTGYILVFVVCTAIILFATKSFYNI